MTDRKRQIEFTNWFRTIAIFTGELYHVVSVKKLLLNTGRIKQLNCGNIEHVFKVSICFCQPPLVWNQYEVAFKQ